MLINYFVMQFFFLGIEMDDFIIGSKKQRIRGQVKEDLGKTSFEGFSAGGTLLLTIRRRAVFMIRKELHKDCLEKCC